MLGVTPHESRNRTLRNQGNSIASLCGFCQTRLVRRAVLFGMILAAGALALGPADARIARSTLAAPECPASVAGNPNIAHTVRPLGDFGVNVFCQYGAGYLAFAWVLRGYVSPNLRPSVGGCGQKVTNPRTNYSDPKYELAGAARYASDGDVWYAALVAFARAAEPYAKPCASATPPPRSSTRHTWLLAGLRAVKFTKFGFALNSTSGTGTFDVSPSGAVTTAAGSLTLTMAGFGTQPWVAAVVHVKLRVEGGTSFVRSSGSVDRLVAKVKVVNLRTSHVDCIADPEGTLELVDGNGVIESSFSLRSVCGLELTDHQVRVNIR